MKKILEKELFYNKPFYYYNKIKPTQLPTIKSNVSISEKLTPRINNKKILKGSSITDMIGLSNAYSSKNGVFVNGDTLYISGTHTARDVYDDLTTIPFNRIEHSERYQQAIKSLEAVPTIKRVVGHSLGGSVALQIEKNYPNKIDFSRVYGTPVLDMNPYINDKVERYRNWFDPISLLDINASSDWSSGLNPHSYNIADNFSTNLNTNNGWINPDNTISLIS